MRNYLFFLLFFIFFISCRQSSVNDSQIQNNFSFSPHKIWAHRVNTLEELEKKHQIFEGLEIDLIYSKYLNNLYVAHDESDTMRGILLEDWINYIPNPEKKWYWFDLKNLNKKNAENIANLLSEILKKYEITDKTICENRNVKALAVLKRKGLAVAYWVNTDVFIWKIFGEKQWKKTIQKDITFLKPNALCCSYTKYPILDTFFPNENILYWHTPVKFSPENVEFTISLCQMPHVKVVLVDYDEPICY